MKASVETIPKGFHAVTPMLTVRGARELIDFMKEVFGAAEINRMEFPDGTIAHAMLTVGDSMVMLGEASKTWQPMPTNLYVYVDDTDEIYQKALDAGAISVMEPANMFYGDRVGAVRDSCGNQWSIATHIEDVSPDEMAKRQAEWLERGHC